MVIFAINRDAELGRMKNRCMTLVALEASVVTYLDDLDRELDESLSGDRPDKAQCRTRAGLLQRRAIVSDRLDATRSELRFLADRLCAIEDGDSLDFASIGGFASLALPGPVSIQRSVARA